MQHSAFQLVMQAGPIVKSVLLILLLFSVVSWAIIIYKQRQLSSAERENESFMQEFGQTRNPDTLLVLSKKFRLSPISNVFRAVSMKDISGNKEELRRSIKRFETLEAEKLERYLGFLATTGSSSPFIGLFGTVWGIMNAFRGIGSAGSASLAVVAPGIAEALIATAMGLAAAIPAVIAYNYYLSKSRRMLVRMSDFSEEIPDLLDKVQADD